jgi:hypothetical protein
LPGRDVGLIKHLNGHVKPWSINRINQRLFAFADFHQLGNSPNDQLV